MSKEPRPDLTNEQLHAMGQREPGSGAAYLAARRKEVAEAEAEQRAKDEDAHDLELFTRAFLEAGGRPADATQAWKAERTRQATDAARRKADAARAASRRSMFNTL